MRRSYHVVILVSVLLFSGCKSNSDQEDQPAPAAQAPASAPAAEHGKTAEDAGATPVYDVACGCSLPAVGRCSEYAKVDGEFIEIVGDHGLGAMPFCGKSGVRAKIAGEVADGKLQATSVEVIGSK